MSQQNRRPANRATPRRRPRVAGVAARPTPPAEPVTAAVAVAAVDVEDAVPAREPTPRRSRRVRVPRPSFAVPSFAVPSWARVGWGPTVVLAVVAVVLAAFATLAAFRPGAAPSNKAYVDGAATDQIKAAAKQALSTVYSYDATTIDGWPAKVHTVLTGDMARDFDKTAQTTIDAVKQSDTKTDVQIDPVGVTLLGSDRAEVLAVVNVSASRNNIATGNVSGPIILDMTKINGRWLAAKVASTYMVGQ